MREIWKTPCRQRAEREEARRRSAPQRDIREIPVELFRTVDSGAKLAALIQVSPATFPERLSEALRGRVEGAGVSRRLVFAGKAERRENPAPELAGSC